MWHIFLWFRWCCCWLASLIRRHSTRPTPNMQIPVPSWVRAFWGKSSFNGSTRQHGLDGVDPWLRRICTTLIQLTHRENSFHHSINTLLRALKRVVGEWQNIFTTEMWNKFDFSHRSICRWQKARDDKGKVEGKWSRHDVGKDDKWLNFAGKWKNKLYLKKSSLISVNYIQQAMFKSFGGPFWFAGLIQLILNVLTFSTPLLLNELILYTGRRPDGTYGPLWQGLVYTFGLFLATFLTSIFNGQFFWYTFVVGFRIRSALISGIYRKSLRISSVAKKDTTVGEIVNLMAVDAQRFFELVSYLHVLWFVLLHVNDEISRFLLCGVWRFELS